MLLHCNQWLATNLLHKTFPLTLIVRSRHQEADNTLKYIGGSGRFTYEDFTLNRKSWFSQRQTKYISATEADSLNKEISIEELYGAASCLGRNKCPGPDGIPLEFILAHWEVVRPSILKALNLGFDRVHLQESFTQGLIVLLRKKRDQRLLTNKRPITLSNVIYKIGAKVFQVRLTPILHNFISQQQWEKHPSLYYFAERNSASG